MFELFKKDKVSKLEEVLRKNSKSQIILKSELASKISEIETFNDDEKKRAVVCVQPYLLRLIDANLIHQECIAKYLSICSRIDMTIIAAVLEHLGRATSPKEKSNMYMLSAGMDNRNFFIKKLKEYQPSLN